jgi:hypothetical protein
MKSLNEIINDLTAKQRQKLIIHFNEIYECNKLQKMEFNIIHLAWLWMNGYVYRDEDGFAWLDDGKPGVPSMNNFEITIEDEQTGGVNLDLTYDYFYIEEIIEILKNK